MADELTNKLNQIVRRIDSQIYKAMKAIAAKGEFNTKELHGWWDDTYSAYESITGYVVRSHNRPVSRAYSYDKNMQNRRWREAMRSGGGRYHNPPWNYYPNLHNTMDIPDDVDAAIICGFVNYLPSLETDWKVGSMTFDRSFKLMQQEAGPIIEHFLKLI